MSDIIERLRAAVPTYEGTPIAWPCEVRSELLLEAAAEVEKRTRERDEARAEVERLKARPAEAEIGRLDAMWQALVRERDEARAEVERLHKAHQAACEGGDLLRAENARLRAQVAEYFREPATHPVEET